MSATATAMLNVARSQIGYKEGPNNDNKYGKWYGMNHAAYCAIGLSWCAEVAGCSSIMGGKWAYCPYWVNYWKRIGRWHNWTETPERGDIAFFNWEGTHGLAEHVGIVDSFDTHAPVIIPIEFNTTSGTGNQSDGGGVYRRRRNTLYVTGYGRPAYGPEGTPTRISRGSDRHLMPLVLDGVWGRLTTQHLQAWLHVATDGQIGPVTRRRLQEALHVTADGVWGLRTHLELQRRLGVPADGVWGPRTVMALQRFLNRTV